jgi:hypothetical protein
MQRFGWAAIKADVTVLTQSRLHHCSWKIATKSLVLSRSPRTTVTFAFLNARPLFTSTSRIYITRLSRESSPIHLPHSLILKRITHVHYAKMNQDRKRAFNRAFSPSSGDPFKRAMRSVGVSCTASTSRIFNTPAFLFGSDKENHTPSLQVRDALSGQPGALKPDFGPQQAFAPHFNQTQVRLPLGTHSLHNCSELQHTANIFGAQNYATTTMQFEQEWFGPSPPGFTSDPASGSPANDVLGSYLDSEPGPVIFEDPDNAMCGQPYQDPLTPSALHFDDLSLQEVPKRTLPVKPSPSMRDAQRTHVFMMRTSVFEP